MYYFFYSRLMRLAHHYDWHHAPVIGPFEDGRYQRWCTWCGFRETFGQTKMEQRGSKSMDI